MHEKTRIAILGCGKMNRSHVKALVRQSERCRVTLAVDTNPERAQEVAELTGAKPARSLDGLWDQFDAIDICTPHHLHASQAIEAMSHGKHVLVEKPMATHEFNAQIAHFLDCIENGETPITSGRSSILALRAIANMYQAELSNRIAVRPAETGSTVATRPE